MDEQTIKALVNDWYRNKAKNETDPFFRFMCMWICFNAWLDFKAQQPTDRKMIDWLKEQDSSASEIIKAYENMTATTVGNQRLKDLATMSPIRDPRSSRPDIVISGPHDRKNVIEGIYRIRCNLFHGGKRSSDTRDEKLVRCANDILNGWLTELLAIW